MKNVVRVSRSRNGKHKFTAEFPDGSRVSFGLRGFSDYTKHKDKERMKRYVGRHAGYSGGRLSRRENWTRAGAKTAGFWSRWLLWSRPSIDAARRHTQQVLGKKIVFVK
jgi:hypothetical protein